ncbi:lysozyme inhibitor LprI family protein [Sphingomonas immobilis]|uniref:Lysozyme inhibitor LprI N-terminal domain-containing protein n=1 Tax=Sphingomonas immobilis TaxID=3063997 RepID=A0ABT9A2E8_9SPHN|nr:hypothetical protein [Sphingomonas sp. CA1-15]MDO7844006.1 hypothetical protein [Sphingomonas sp. CA1-15]
MAKSACKLCKQDISEVTLIRCRDAACPLLTKSTAGTGVSTVGLLAVGSVALCAVVFGWRMGAPAPAAPSPTPTATAAAIAVTAAAPASAAKKNGWSERFAALFLPPKHEQTEDSAPDALPAGPDPQAATRVQTFSCDGRTSPARALICTDWTLATVDYNLSLAYSQALAHSRSPKAIRKAQAVWEAKIDTLRADSKAVLEAYRQRYAELDVVPAT